MLLHSSTFSLGILVKPKEQDCMPSTSAHAAVLPGWENAGTQGDCSMLAGLEAQSPLPGSSPPSREQRVDKTVPSCGCDHHKVLLLWLKHFLPRLPVAWAALRGGTTTLGPSKVRTQAVPSLVTASERPLYKVELSEGYLKETAQTQHVLPYPYSFLSKQINPMTSTHLH